MVAVTELVPELDRNWSGIWLARDLSVPDHPQVARATMRALVSKAGLTVEEFWFWSVDLRVLIALAGRKVCWSARVRISSGSAR
jgi:hypothetical protein